MNNAYQAYAAATQTVAKTRQIVMLYDGAIRCVQQAMEAMRDKHIEERFKLLTKATDIISALQGCLDFEQGGQVAPILFQFYRSVESRLFTVQHTNSMDICEQVVQDLKQMRDVWDEIDRSLTVDGEKPATSTPPSDGGDAGVAISA